MYIKIHWLPIYRRNRWIRLYSICARARKETKERDKNNNNNGSTKSKVLNCRFAGNCIDRDRLIKTVFLKHVRTDRCSPLIQANDDDEDDRDGSGDGFDAITPYSLFCCVSDYRAYCKYDTRACARTCINRKWSMAANCSPAKWKHLNSTASNKMLFIIVCFSFDCNFSNWLFNGYIVERYTRAVSFN